ncbi:hypothetical protein QYM36_014791 [Artemia franciscana]|uniref:Uncharacterized protein n=1 Tax=Artemia franciscana TaxID=6661 RepID=A0AA88KYS3_ARTSF|nr:hypothetical protein QYM36_014791 [Artemia franciscana]
MKVTPTLLKQHLLRQFNNKWIALGKVVIHENDAKQKCEELGLKVYDPLEEFSKPKEADYEVSYVKVAPDLLQDEPYVYPNNKTHPDWKEEPVLYHDHSTELLGGLKQAQSLTKSIVIQGMPERVQSLIDNPVITFEDDQAERIVFKTHLLDAVQKKLPRIFEGPWTLNPYRHAKPYGPEKKRRNHSMINQLILTADRLSTKVDPRLSARILRKCPKISVPVELHGKKIYFFVTPSAMLLSDKSISPYASSQLMENLNTLSLPDIYPMHPTVNINPSNIYPTTPLSCKYFLILFIKSGYAYSSFIGER